MLRFRKLLLLAVALAGVIVLGGPAGARADFSLQVYQDGVLLDSKSFNTNQIQVNQTFGSYYITGNILFTNSPGDVNNGNIQISGMTIENNDGLTHTLALVLSASNFTSPGQAGSQMVLSSTASITGTGLLNGSDSFTYQGYADANNNLFGTTSPPPLGGVGSAGAVTTGLSSFSTTAGNLTQGATDTKTATFIRTQDLYSLTSISTFTMNGGGTIGFTTSTAAALPAPAGIVLALSGAPLLGLGHWLRRRRQPV
jgi:hypothetical protein